MFCVTAMEAAVPWVGVMVKSFVAGVATEAMLKPMVWASALLSFRLAVATPFVKVTEMV